MKQCVSINGWDFLVTGIFGLYAVAFALGVWCGTSPFPLLGSDASNIAGFIAARDQPEAFANDSFLGSFENFRYYLTIHIFLWRSLARLTGDYGTAALASLPFQIVLQGCGFYLLGRAILGGRLWPFLLAVLSIPFLRLSVSYWGIYKDPVPQATFQCLLPWLLYAAYTWREAPSRWPWLMAISGLLMYVHSVSAPAWAFALWLGFIFDMPREWSVQRRVLWAFGLGLVFIAVAAPFMSNFASHRSYGTLPDYEDIAETVKVRLPAEFYDVRLALTNFMGVVTKRIPLIVVAGLCGLMLSLVSERDRGRLSLVPVWMIGVVAVSTFVPLCEQYLASRLRSLPFQIEIVRNLRFVVWFLQFYSIYLLARAHGALAVWRPGRLPSAGTRLLPFCPLLAAYLIWSSSPEPLAYADRSIEAWSGGRLVPMPSGDDTLFAEFIAALPAAVPPGSRVLPAVERDPDRFQAIRYAALRPISHIFKDGGTLTANNLEGFRAWHRRHLKLRSLQEKRDSAEYFEELFEFARETNSAYLIVDREPPSRLASRVRVRKTHPNGAGFTLLEVE